MYQLISKKMSKKRKGFTLIELVVVIAILGILAAIAIPRLSTFRETAQKSANDATAAVVGKATEAYLATLSQTDYTTVTGLTDIWADTTHGPALKEFVDETTAALTDIKVTATAGTVKVEGPGTGDAKGEYPVTP